MLLTVSYFVAQFASTFVVTYLNRRIQMFIGCATMAVANGLNGVYAYAISDVFENKTADKRTMAGMTEFIASASSWWPVLGFSIWFCSYSLGMANALHLVMGEILPAQVGYQYRS